MSRGTYWDRRRKFVCPVCEKEVKHDEYYLVALDRPERLNLFVHKEGCLEKVIENPQILQKIFK